MPLTTFVCPSCDESDMQVDMGLHTIWLICKGCGAEATIVVYHRVKVVVRDEDGRAGVYNPDPAPDLNAISRD